MSAQPSFDLTGRVALVTGASSGLGRHFASVLAGAGAKVVLAARREERLREAVDALRVDGRDAISVPLDVTDAQSVADAVAAAEDAFGPIGILVNNAGVADERWFTKTSDADWRKLMDVNLDGVFRVGRDVAARMQHHGNGGAIVNIASVLGSSVLPMVSAYAVSKAAVIQMTKAMAVELARDGIRVNALAPGYFSSEITEDFLRSDAGKKLVSRIPMKRIGAHDELDAPLLLLASDAGRYMTGSVVTVDGGALLAMS